MHICFVTTEFVTEGFFCGGLANFTANMAQIFYENKHKVTVLVATHKNKNYIWNGGINVVCVNRFENNLISYLSSGKFKNINSSIFIQKVIGSYICREKIKEINSNNKIDIIHYCNLEGLALITNDIPYIVRLSCYNNLWKGAYKQYFSNNYRDNPKDATDFIEELSVRHSKVVVSPSKLLADITENNLDKKAIVIESPYYLNNLQWDYNIYKDKLEGKKYALFFGTLGYMKGAHILADIVYEFLDKYKDIHLVMIGKEKNIYKGKKECKASYVIKENAREYKDRVIYFNEIGKDSLYPIIKNASFCILPSRIDNLPNTCIEAMSLKKIVIGTYNASFEQIIENGVSGYLCKMDVPKSYLNAIDKVMKLSQEEKVFMENMAFSRTKLLEPKRIYMQYMLLYKKVIRISNSSNIGKRRFSCIKILNMILGKNLMRM